MKFSVKKRSLPKEMEKLWSKHFNTCIVVSYWLLGLCNNFGYVIMLSGAHDILSTDNDNATKPSNNATNRFDCNEISTGAILLCDILPCLIIKLIAPFLPHPKYHYRVIFVVAMNAISFLMVSLSPTSMQYLIFTGVAFASIASGYGELTFLSLSTLYTRELSISGWSSGTGAAGLIGSGGYALIIEAGVSPRNTILIMTFIPVLMAISYVLLPSIKYTKARLEPIVASEDSENDVDFDAGSTDQLFSKMAPSPSFRGTVMDRLRLIRPLLKFMIPLFLVYIAEYFINQGLYELLYFKDGDIPSHKQQYRWYNVAYQLSVFISRSSIKWIQISFLPIFPIFQLINVGVLLSQIFLNYMKSIWIVFAIVLFEGLLGGACYANGFNQVSIEVPKEKREASIAITSIADSFGITLAALISIPVHNAICEYGNN